MKSFVKDFFRFNILLFVNKQKTSYVIVNEHLDF